jgi:hypothetical protein
LTPDWATEWVRKVSTWGHLKNVISFSWPGAFFLN